MTVPEPTETLEAVDVLAERIADAVLFTLGDAPIIAHETAVEVAFADPPMPAIRRRGGPLPDAVQSVRLETTVSSAAVRALKASAAALAFAPGASLPQRIRDTSRYTIRWAARDEVRIRMAPLIDVIDRAGEVLTLRDDNGEMPPFRRFESYVVESARTA